VLNTPQSEAKYIARCQPPQHPYYRHHQQQQQQQQHQHHKPFNSNNTAPISKSQKSEIKSLARSLCSTNFNKSSRQGTTTMASQYDSAVFLDNKAKQTNGLHANMLINGEHPQSTTSQRILRTPRLFPVPEPIVIHRPTTTNINISFPNTPAGAFTPPATPQGELSSATINTVLSALKTLYVDTE
jgi:hypothetical protein